ncbi:MAG: flagellar hook-associated protein FlgK [Deltaproteobacteria bacterium]|nr:flagellar hook-associated protein FlgK [Deltaproteobacteria bacterium]
MSGLSAILNIAQGAMNATQMAMQVISHNIANVNTPGYTRQKAVVQTQAPLDLNRLKIGTGVLVDSVTQCFDRFTTRAIHEKTSSLKDYESKALVLSSVEASWNETEESSLSQTLDEFWNAWQDLASNPGGTAERTALLEKAKILTGKFNSLSQELGQTAQNLNTNIQMGVEEVNRLAGQIAKLNEQIGAAEGSQTTANDLRDQRNQLLEELSGWVGITYLEQDNGSVTVLTREGLLLVNGHESWDLSAAGDSIYYNGIENDVSDRLTGGKIGGWLDLRDETLPQYRANLDEMAGTLIQGVNNLHRAGYTLSGGTGMNFFEDFQTAPGVPNPGDYSGAAAYISLSSDVLGSPENIAAGGASGAPGDNGNALSIAALQTDGSLNIRKWTITDRGETTSSRLQTGTLDDYYQSLIGELGILAEETNENQDSTQSLLDSLAKVRDSVSGVNLDEELTEMMKVQHAYEAASKVIAATDQMMQTLLDMR